MQKVSPGSPTQNWHDVGGVGSTTATWRGYANAVVGDDWYDGAWRHRIKITVASALATGTDITNFPVYVNLDDLPATFFDRVQSDGDDLRITTTDGITEVPYELVSIHTTTDKGELYFKAPACQRQPILRFIFIMVITLLLATAFQVPMDVIMSGQIIMRPSGT